MSARRRFPFSGAARELGAVPIDTPAPNLGWCGGKPILRGYWGARPIVAIYRGPFDAGEPFDDGTFFDDGTGWSPRSS